MPANWMPLGAGAGWNTGIVWVSVMGHGPCTFKKRDVKTAVEAVRESGVEVARVEIGKDGKIVVVAGKPVSGEQTANDWDEVLTNDSHEKRPS